VFRSIFSLAEESPLFCCIGIAVDGENIYDSINVSFDALTGPCRQVYIEHAFRSFGDCPSTSLRGLCASHAFVIHSIFLLRLRRSRLLFLSSSSWAVGVRSASIRSRRASALCGRVGRVLDACDDLVEYSGEVAHLLFETFINVY
jgi:hypothetical protein